VRIGVSAVLGAVLRACYLVPYGFILLFGVLFPVVFGVGKVRLFVRTREGNKGSYIASVPVRELVRLSVYRKKRWSFEDGWLVLEAF